MNFDTGVISVSSPSMGAWARAARHERDEGPSDGRSERQANRVMDSSSGSAGLMANRAGP